jgi:predicted deacylase
MISVVGKTFGPTQRGIVRLPVTTMASGQPLEIAVHVQTGKAPAPVVALVAAHHGDEVFAVEVLRAITQRLAGIEPVGTILLVPMANPTAFEAGTRHTPLDMMNLNRLFPGRRDGWLTEQLAAVLTDALLGRLDLLVDFHSGADATEVDYTYTRPRTNDLTRRIHELALLTGARALWETPLPAGTLAGEAERRGIPWCVIESGGSPAFGSERLARTVDRTMDVLRAAGVVPGTPSASQAEVVIREGMATRPSRGGLFVPRHGSEIMGQPIPKDMVVGTVHSPHTFEELEVLRAPFEPSYVMMARTRPSRVHAGDYAYLFGNGATAENVRRA